MARCALPAWYNVYRNRNNWEPIASGSQAPWQYSGTHCLWLTSSRADRILAMGYRLIQTRRGSMLVRTPSAAQRRKARQQAKSVRRAMAKRCKCWHGEAARLYHEELTRNKQIKAGVSDNAISSRREVADAPPEGAKPQVHNAGCAMKPPGQSVGTDSKIDSLAQKNVLTLAQAAGAACETAQDSLQMDRTVLGQNQHKPSCDKGSRQLPKSCTSTK
jgi:hypothetical protein